MRNNHTPHARMGPTEWRLHREDLAQILALFKPPPRDLIGEDGRGNAAIAWQIICDQLNRLLRPDRWDILTIASPHCICDEWSLEGSEGASKRGVTYSTTVGLVAHLAIGNEISTVRRDRTGSFTAYMRSPAESHEMASMACEAIALKRAAVTLGPFFGLSLYCGSKPSDQLPMTQAPPWILNKGGP